jgi:predicted deacylase
MIKNIFTLFFCFNLVVLASCQPPEQPTNISLSGESYDPPNSTDTRSKPILFQKRKTFQVNGIYVSNEFYGGRIDNVQADNRKKNSLIITIAPENFPINHSAWYAFRIWSDEEKDVSIKLIYKEGRHRYIPKISSDGENWKTISSQYFRHNERKETAELQLRVSPNSLWISAQELMTSKEVFAWADTLQQMEYVTGDTVGYSTLNKAIRVLKIAETEQKNIVIVLSRQHPPEVTGQFAAQYFVETILDSSDLARRFRKKFQVIAFPLINPDGADQGHWRHNVGGVDLNRDWHKFRQPETKNVSEYLKKELLNDSTRVWYGFDFHSTGSDILYPISNDYIPDESSITRLWIDNMNLRLPNKWEEEPFDISSPIAKNWIYRTFGAEAITYEIGDETPRDFVKLKSKIAAEEMMKILLIRVNR